MKLKTVILIGLFFAALFLVVVYVDKKEGEKKGEEYHSRELLTFDKDEVDELSIENASGRVVCRKVGEDWQIVEPVTVDAHRGAIQAVLANLERARLTRFLVLDDESTEGALKKYGLDFPHVKVSLHVGGRLLDTVLFGDENPSGRYVYVKKDSEDRIGMVELYRRTGVDKQWSELRNKTTLKFKRALATKLRIESQADTVEVTKSGEEWQMESPTEAKGDGEAIEAILQGLASPVEEFVDDAPNSLRPYGLDPPALRVEVSVGDAVHSLWVGSEQEGNYYAKDLSRAPVFTLDSSFVNQLNRASFELKSRKLFDFTREEVNRVEFAYRDSSILCVRDSVVWLAVPQDRPINAMELKAVLFNMEKLKVEKFPPLAQNSHRDYGLNPPRMRIRLWAGEETVGDLSLGEEEGDLVYVKKGENDLICLVDGKIAESLTAERLFAPEQR